MKCPVCKANVNELDEVCPVCKANFDDYEKGKEKFKEEPKKTNADYLNFMAIINIILSIIVTLAIWINYGTTRYDELNWVGILSGIAVLIAGFTLYFLLKTVIDIYDKIEVEN